MPRDAADDGAADERADRDGEAAHALLLFNHADVFTQERLIESNHPSEAVIADVWNVLQTAEVFARGQQALANAVVAGLGLLVFLVLLLATGWIAALISSPRSACR